MADDGIDIDAMLDGALDVKNSPSNTNGVNTSKEDTKSSRDRSRSRSGSRDRKKRKRSSSRDRKRSRSTSRDRRRKRSRSLDRRRRSRSTEKRRRSRSRSGDRRKRSRSRSRDRRRRRSPSPYRRPRVIDHRDRRMSPRRSPPRGRLPGPERRDVMPFTARQSPPKGARTDLTAEERDQRTLFVMQIARQTRPRDLEEFFSAVGNVRDVRIITDSRTGRSKGISYVEFWEEESVPLGLALNGQRLLGAPLLIQRTCAERNRAANASAVTSLGFGPTPNKGPCKVKVDNLHPKITDSMLRDVFDAFGRIEKVDLPTDASGDGLGSATVIFRNAEDATRAVEQLNNFELAGKSIKVAIVDTEREEDSVKQRSLDDMEDRQGVSLGPGGRMNLMAKLAAGTGSGMEIPESTRQVAEQVNDPSIPAIATQCFMLSNMFDPKTETEANWDAEVREDVIEECTKHGGALHVFVDKGSDQGNVYVKCPSIVIAHKAVSALHGRWFSGKVITANYVPVQSYHELFPDAVNARSALTQRGAPPAIPPPPIPQAYGGYGMPMMPPPPMPGFGGGYY